MGRCLLDLAECAQMCCKVLVSQTNSTKSVVMYDLARQVLNMFIHTVRTGPDLKMATPDTVSDSLRHYKS